MKNENLIVSSKFLANYTDMILLENLLFLHSFVILPLLYATFIYNVCLSFLLGGHRCSVLIFFIFVVFCFAL